MTTLERTRSNPRPLFLSPSPRSGHHVDCNCRHSIKAVRSSARTSTTEVSNMSCLAPAPLSSAACWNANPNLLPCQPKPPASMFILKLTFSAHLQTLAPPSPRRRGTCPCLRSDTPRQTAKTVRLCLISRLSPPIDLLWRRRARERDGTASRDEQTVVDQVPLSAHRIGMSSAAVSYSSPARTIPDG
jgi:hypothetical protein